MVSQLTLKSSFTNLQNEVGVIVQSKEDNTLETKLEIF